MVEDKKSMKMDVETECALEQEDIKSGKRSGDYILEIRGISKSYPGVQALSTVSQHLQNDEVLTQVGETDARKSTMMKILAGVYTLDAGDILIDGESVIIGSVERATNLGIALVHQE